MLIQVLIQWTANLLRACALSLEICGTLGTLASIHYLALFVVLIGSTYFGLHFVKSLAAYALHYIIHLRVDSEGYKCCEGQGICHPCPTYFGRIHHVCTGNGAKKWDETFKNPDKPVAFGIDNKSYVELNVKAIAQELHQLLGTSSFGSALQTAEGKILELEHELNRTREQLSELSPRSKEKVDQPYRSSKNIEFKPITIKTEKRNARLSSLRTAILAEERVTKRSFKLRSQIVSLSNEESVDTSITIQAQKHSQDSTNKYKDLSDSVSKPIVLSDNVKNRGGQTEYEDQGHEVGVIGAIRPQSAPTDQPVDQSQESGNVDEISTEREVPNDSQPPKLHVTVIEEPGDSDTAILPVLEQSGSVLPQQVGTSSDEEMIGPQPQSQIVAEGLSHRSKPASVVRSFARRSSVHPTTVTPLRSAVSKSRKYASKLGLKVRFLDDGLLEEAEANAEVYVTARLEEQTSPIHALPDENETALKLLQYSTTEKLSCHETSATSYQSEAPISQNVVSKAGLDVKEAENILADYHSRENTVSAVRNATTDASQEGDPTLAIQLENIANIHAWSPAETAHGDHESQSLGTIAESPVLTALAPQSTTIAIPELSSNLIEIEPFSLQDVSLDLSTSCGLPQQSRSRSSSPMSIISTDARMLDEESALHSLQPDLVVEEDVAMKEAQTESTTTHHSLNERAGSLFVVPILSPNYDVDGSKIGQNQGTGSLEAASPECLSEWSRFLDDADALDAFTSIGHIDAVPPQFQSPANESDTSPKIQELAEPPARVKMWDSLSKFLKPESIPQTSNNHTQSHFSKTSKPLEQIRSLDQAVETLQNLQQESSATATNEVVHEDQLYADNELTSLGHEILRDESLQLSALEDGFYATAAENELVNRHDRDEIVHLWSEIHGQLSRCLAGWPNDYIENEDAVAMRDRFLRMKPLGYITDDIKSLGVIEILQNSIFPAFPGMIHPDSDEAHSIINAIRRGMHLPKLLDRETLHSQAEHKMISSESSELFEVPPSQIDDMDSDLESLESASIRTESISSSDEHLDCEQLSQKISEASIEDVMRDPHDLQLSMRRTIHGVLMQNAKSVLFEPKRTLTQLRRIYKGVKDPQQSARQNLRVQIDHFRMIIVEMYRLRKKRRTSFTECCSPDHTLLLRQRKDILRSFRKIYTVESARLDHDPTMAGLQMVFEELNRIHLQLKDDPILLPQAELHNYADCFNDTDTCSAEDATISTTDIMSELQSVRMSIIARLNKTMTFDYGGCVDGNHHIVVAKLKQELLNLEGRCEHCSLRLKHGRQVDRNWERLEIEYLQKCVQALNSSEKLQHQFPFCGLAEEDCHSVRSESLSSTTDSSDHAEDDVRSQGRSDHGYDNDDVGSPQSQQDVGYGILPKRTLRLIVSRRDSLSSGSSGEIDLAPPPPELRMSPPHAAPANTEE